MSIINEALKKTQKYLESKNQPATPVSSSMSSPLTTPPGPSTVNPTLSATGEKKQILPTALTIVVLGLVGCAVIFFLIALKNRQVSTSLSVQQQGIQPPALDSSLPAETAPTPVMA